MQGNYLTTEQAAEYLSLSASYLAKLRMTDSKTVGPRFMKVGLRGVRYAKADLDHWMEARSVPRGSNPVNRDG